LAFRLLACFAEIAMGTVGISFGSPTSGTGFDVSTTVSAIMANLENVETPWKTQLTTLDSQDTAISSLGTLLSNLSNDLTQLTDFTGVMAEKTGSSSDTNVLELTAATSSAVAGTHTVVVNGLAATSSGYLAEVPSASTTLSGSIKLQVGTGTAQTITLSSSDNTLTGLAAAINSSGVGIIASVLTDASGSRLSLVSGTSGANGNITVSNNTLTAPTANILSYSGMAGSSTVTSNGTLAPVASLSDALSGSMSIQVGSLTAATVTMAEVNSAEGGTTLADVASYIQTNSPALGVTATVVTNSDGTSSLSLKSSTPGPTGTLTVSSSISDPSTALGFNSTVTGSNASLTVDGVNLTSASNTVTNLIPGVTFQLLATSAAGSGGSPEPVQVVIGNDNTNVESTINQMVTDYNSLISAMNTQQGNDSSGNPEPLFGSPTLSLLQQQLMGGLNAQNPNGYLTAIAVNSSTALTGSMTIQVGDGTTKTVMIGAAPPTPAANTIYTGSGEDTLQGLVNAINGAAPATPVAFSSTASSSGTMTASNTAALGGSISIQVGSGAAQTIYLGPSSDAPSGDLATGTSSNTLSSLESYISANSSSLGVTASIVDNGNGTSTMSLASSGSAALTVTSNVDIPGLGVTAGITTSNGKSTLSLLSQTAGSAGAVNVTSSLTATGDTALDYTGLSGGGGYNSSGTLDSIPSAADNLSGSISIQVGSLAPRVVNVPNSPNNTLQGLADAITGTAGIGVTATVNTNSDGKAYLALESQTAGTAGNLTVTSNILDTTNTTTTNLAYNNSSDISTLANLGITVAQTDDGTLSLDASVLDSALNSDYSGVLGFFQDANSWGQSFSAMLENAGTSSPTGVLALAHTANSNVESTLNADIKKQNSLISAQQISLTAELNSANEIMQELPTQLQGVNELYSAISGYNQNQNG
jgi:flagellar hook-associated protein 2